MLETVKRTVPAVQIVPGPFSCTSINHEGAPQACTLISIFVITKKYLLKSRGVWVE